MSSYSPRELSPEERCYEDGHDYDLDPVFLYDPNEDWENTLGNCWFGDECCMPGIHYPDECHTAEMLAKQWEYYDYINRVEDLRQRFFVVNLTLNAVEWLRRRFRDVRYYLQRNKQDEIPF